MQGTRANQRICKKSGKKRVAAKNHSHLYIQRLHQISIFCKPDEINKHPWYHKEINEMKGEKIQWI